MACIDGSCRVLSIQSHVVSGHVGNKAAVFPLQLLGFDVDFINSVQFSNHTGYPNKWKGTVLSGTELSALCTGLADNNLLRYDYLLTGYIGSETFLSSVIETLDAIVDTNPSARYVCDPVLGDHDQYYVPAALVAIFRTKLIPRAYMITPNQFEAELLTGMKIHSEGDAVKALIQLHKLGPQVVVLTSAELSEPPAPEAAECDSDGSPTLSTEHSSTAGAGASASASASADASGGRLHCYVLHPCGDAATPPPQQPEVGGERAVGCERRVMITRIEIDKIEGHYTGTGDATAALMLAWVHILQQQEEAHAAGQSSAEAAEPGASSSGSSPYSQALQNALATVKAMISRSRDFVHAQSAVGEGSVAQDWALIRARELRVVQSKRDIEQPPLQRLGARSVRTWCVDVE